MSFRGILEEKHTFHFDLQVVTSRKSYNDFIIFSINCKKKKKNGFRPACKNSKFNQTSFFPPHCCIQIKTDLYDV